MAQHARNFLRLTLGAPFSPQTRTQPISQKAQANMIDHSIWPPVVNGANFQITPEFAKGFFHVQQPLVMTQHLLSRTFLDRLIGVQQIPTVLLGFLSNQFSLAFPLQFPLGVYVVSKILVGFESLQAAAHLTG